MKQNNEVSGVVSKHKNFKVEVRYSPKAIKDKLIRFTVRGDYKSFEISSDDLIQLLMTQVNMDVLSPTFVDTTRVNVVNVMRQMQAKLEKDMKKGEIIRLNYVHPYPVEFAIIEEAMKIAKIEGIEKTELTKEFIEKVKSQIEPRMEEFTKKFYESYNQLNKKEDNPQK